MILIWDVPACCPTAQAVLPISHQHRQNKAEGGTTKIKVNPTKVLQEMGPPVQPADIGLPTGNGKKLSYSQAQLGQATCLAVAQFLSISGGPSYVRRLYRCFRRLPNSRTADFFRILTAVHTNIMDLREFINVSKRVEVHSFESEENHDNEEKMEVRQQKAF